MMKTQNATKLFILLFALAGLASCDKGQETAEFEVTGDVFISKRIINAETKYARSFYAYGNQPMTSVEVTLSEGGVLALSEADETLRTWIDLPTLADFETIVPEDGIFDFTVVNEDIEHTVSDIVEFTDPDIPTIDSVKYTSQTVYVGWESASGADRYIVQMVDENNELVFIGQLLNSDFVKYVIADASGTWNQNPEFGITYKVEVHAFFFEDNATVENYQYNVNEVTIASEDVVWGN